MKSAKVAVSVLLFLALLALPLRGQDLQGIVNITFLTDMRLFTVMSAINAGGFDYETAASMHPVRRQVRERLKGLDPQFLRRLHDFYVAHHVAGESPQREIARYTSLALLLTEPPGLEISVPPKDLPRDVEEVTGFQQILPSFFVQAGLDQLWLQARPQYLDEIEKYKPVARQSIIQALTYLRTEARIVLDRKILFIPDLMSAHGVTNSRIVGNLYYLVVGPAEEPEKNARNIRHEYLHFLLDPLIEKNGAAIVQQQEALQLLADRPELLEKFRKDLKLLNTESLIEAIQLRVEPSPNVQERLAEQYAEGNVLVYHYYERLQDFENAAVSFPEFLPSIIQAFNLRRELQRKDWFVAEMEKQKQERRQRLAAQNEQREWNAGLEQVNALLRQKNYADAEKLLKELKEKRPNDPSVLFGLGQIELQRRNPAAAEAYYKAVLSQPQTPAWMTAWSRIHLATVYLATERLQEARAQLLEVAQITGDLRGAQEEARKRLAALPSS